MAKIRKPDQVSTPESLQDSLPTLIQHFDPSAQTSSSPSAANAESSTILVEVPFAVNYPPSEFIVHLDVHLTLAQSTAIRRVARQLDRKQAYLRNGQRVVNTNAAVKWLLEQIIPI